MVTYNAQGDKVDSLPIGGIVYEGGFRAVTTLIESEITVSVSGLDSGEVARIDTHELGKDLKFKETKRWNEK